ncbi:MAG: SPFH domain-containing protein [Oscillospiraceae bacterium]|nr:SPFH domain-containing protein [Oscillospiraceae bacterium]
MGLIAAGLGALGGVLADQWKEFFYCDAIDKNVLAVKGQKRISGRSSNTKGNDNIISNGSVIAVADGQCMIIVEQGKIVEVCAEPGEFVWDSSTEPSIFTGKLGTSIKETFKLIGKRFTFGGDPGKDQRVYYFNTKEIIDNKFGTPTPIPFRIVDRNINLDIDVSVRCSGVYSYRVVDPLLFYANVCGNVERDYSRTEIDSQLKTEFVSALQPAFAKISELQVRPSALPGHAEELSDAMNAALSKKWGELRGIQVVSIAMNPITLSEEDQELIKKAQHAAIMRDPTMAAATLVEAQSQAMKDAANNSAGAMTGFMGFGMAQQAGGVNAQNLFAMGQQQQASAPAKEEPKGETWTCTCGTVNTSKFCSECGYPKPETKGGWICSKCGSVNKGKFCMECGTKKPVGEPLYKCDKCGWEPEDPKNPPKFCPECGDIFDDSDIQ